MAEELDSSVRWNDERRVIGRLDRRDRLTMMKRFAQLLEPGDRELRDHRRYALGCAVLAATYRAWSRSKMRRKRGRPSLRATEFL